MEQAPMVKARIFRVEATRGACDEPLLPLRSLEGDDSRLAGLIVIDFAQHLLSMRLALGL